MIVSLGLVFKAVLGRFRRQDLSCVTWRFDEITAISFNTILYCIVKRILQIVDFDRKGENPEGGGWVSAIFFNPFQIFWCLLFFPPKIHRIFTFFSFRLGNLLPCCKMWIFISTSIESKNILLFFSHREKKHFLPNERYKIVHNFFSLCRPVPIS